MNQPVKFDAIDLVDRLLGDERLAKHVVESFLSDMPRQLSLLAESLNTEDAYNTRMNAHSIKGAAANAGATGVCRTAGQLEHLGLEGKLPEAKKLLPELAAEMESVSAALQSFCDSVR